MYLQKRQPVIANAGSNYLCTVIESFDDLYPGYVNVIAEIKENDTLKILDGSRCECWYVRQNYDHAADLYDEYLRITGAEAVEALVKFSKEEVKEYSIKGRMI